MSVAAVLFALPIALVGAWYTFQAGTAAKLAGREGNRANRVRVRLRRINGLAIVVAGFLLYFVISRAQQLAAGGPGEGGAGVLLPLAVIALVPLTALMLVLAWLDLRLTRRMKRLLPGATAAVLMLVVGCGEEAAEPAAIASPPATRQADPPKPPTTTNPAPQPQSLPTVEQPLGDTTFTLMIADDDAERQIGLMHRREMGRDEGMVFVFPADRTNGFWMANTLLPLDLIFVGEGGRVLDVLQGRPLDRRTSLRPAGPYRYVIELNRGRAAEAGVMAGVQLDLSPTLAAAELR